MPKSYLIPGLLLSAVCPTSLIAASLFGRLHKDRGSNRFENAQAMQFVIKPLDKDREKKLGTIREFIWSHWKQKEKGQVIATLISKEGVQSDFTFAIETNEQGGRVLRVTIERPKLKGTTMEHAQYTASKVQRVGLQPRGSSEPAYVPEGEETPGSLYRLVFYDDQGKEKGGI